MFAERPHPHAYTHLHIKIEIRLSLCLLDLTLYIARPYHYKTVLDRKLSEAYFVILAAGRRKSCQRPGGRGGSFADRLGGPSSDAANEF